MSSSENGVIGSLPELVSRLLRLHVHGKASYHTPIHAVLPTVMGATTSAGEGLARERFGVPEAGSGGDQMFSTRIGRMGTFDGLDDYAMPGYRQPAEEWRSLQDQGIDAFRMAVDSIHEAGMECHAGYRVAGIHNPPAHDNFDFGDSYYLRHPEHRGIDRNSNATPRIAYSNLKDPRVCRWSAKMGRI